MDVNPQGSHIHFRDRWTPWINDPNSVSMEDQAHDLNLLKGRCGSTIVGNSVFFQSDVPLSHALLHRGHRGQHGGAVRRVELEERG